MSVRQIEVSEEVWREIAERAGASVRLRTTFFAAYSSCRMRPRVRSRARVSFCRLARLEPYGRERG
jgi:hypothetical protein